MFLAHATLKTEFSVQIFIHLQLYSEEFQSLVNLEGGLYKAALKTRFL